MEPPNPTLISRKKLPKELPNSDKFANITRPLIGLNCETQARKSKSNQSKPKNKAVVKNQVSKTAIVHIHQNFGISFRYHPL